MNLKGFFNKQLIMEAKEIIILNAITRFSNLTPKELFFNTRKKEIVSNRQLFYYLCRKYTNLTYEKIGQIGFRYTSNYQDHATVLHAVKTIKGYLVVDHSYRKEVYTLINRLDKEMKICDDIDFALKIENSSDQSNSGYLLKGITVENSELREEIEKLNMRLKDWVEIEDTFNKRLYSLIKKMNIKEKNDLLFKAETTLKLKRMFEDNDKKTSVNIGPDKGLMHIPNTYRRSM